jgi:predicted metal-dependent hydrolase
MFAHPILDRPVKNINLRIRADGSVYVSANKSVPLDIVEAFLTRKSAYILDAIDKYADLAKYVQSDRKFVTGESYRYLGKELRLQVSQGKPNVHSDGIYLYLAVNDVGDNEAKEKLINKWYDITYRRI